LRLYKGKYINEAQVVTFLLLNILLGGLIFLTVFKEDTAEKVFWANYTARLDRINKNILTNSEMYDLYPHAQLLKNIQQNLLSLEEQLFFTKEGGIIRFEGEEIEVQHVLNPQVYKQIETLYQIFKSDEKRLSRSFAILKEATPNELNQAKDTYLAQIHKFSRSIQLENENLQKAISRHQQDAALQRKIFLVCCLLFFLLLNGYLIYRLHKDVFLAIAEVTGSLQRYFSKENKVVNDHEQLGDTIEQLKSSVNSFVKNVETASDFALKIGDGNLEAKTGSLDTSNILGRALLEMQNKLQQVTDEDSRRNWISNGTSQIGDVFSGYQGFEFKEKVFRFTKLITDYMSCNQGAVFLADSKTSTLNLFAAYAYEKKKFINKSLKVDEGLLGQCFQEKDILYLEDIPADYIHITSGLGYANPRSLLLIPVILEDECYGIIELASFEKLPTYYLNFSKIVSDKLASAISTHKMNEHTTKLLSESRKMNEELTQKEEQMQSYTAQLSKEYAAISKQLSVAKVAESDVKKLHETEEELKRLQAEINKFSELLTVRNNEIDQQDIKLETKQKIIKNLQEKLKVLKNKELLEGDQQHVHEIGENNLALKEKIAQLEGEKLLNQSTISSISQSIPTAELNLKGEIIAANQLFVQKFGFEEQEVIGRHESIFIAASKEVNKINEQKWKKLLEGQAFDAELHFIKKNKDTLLLKASYTPVKSPSGRLFKVILLVQGISL
jgi:methyl-accepting chemotaxis protein